MDNLDDKKKKYIELVKQIAAHKKSKTVIPKMDTILEMLKVVFLYIKNNKRIMYGGTALHRVIKLKNDVGIYDNFTTKKYFNLDEDLHDIEFYSPDPLYDVYKLCNELKNRGGKYIYGSEAIHPETYAIRVFSRQICDITYVPKNIYKRLPIKNIDGINVIGNEFLKIDLYRQMSNPYYGFLKLDKVVFRKDLLEKYYPIYFNKNNLNVYTKNETSFDEVLQNIYKNIVINDKNIIVIGEIVLNYYLKISNDKRIRVNYIEIISVNMKDTMLKIKEKLKEYNPSYKEYNVYFQFWGSQVEVYIKEKLVVKIYDYNKICTPYITFKERDNDFVLLGSFDLQIMMLYTKISKILISSMDKNEINKLYYYIFLFKKCRENNKSNKLVMELVTDCIGEVVDTRIISSMQKDERRKKGQRLVIGFNPDNKNPESFLKLARSFKFDNSSGRLKDSDFKFINL